MPVKYSGTKNSIVLFPWIVLNKALQIAPIINTSNNPITNKPSFKSFL